MTGCPLYNFPAFDECRDSLKNMGYIVTSPADLDRAVGFDPATSTVPKEFLDEAMQRDLDAMCASSWSFERTLAMRNSG